MRNRRDHCGPTGPVAPGPGTRSRRVRRHARSRRPPLGIDWVLGDIAAWSPQKPVDLIYSNAALHWLDDHTTLIPDLIGKLRPGGVLAVQMPRNHSAPSHQVLFATARGSAWTDRLGELVQERPVAEPADYYALIAPLVDG